MNKLLTQLATTPTAKLIEKIALHIKKHPMSTVLLNESEHDLLKQHGIQA